MLVSKGWHYSIFRLSQFPQSVLSALMNGFLFHSWSYEWPNGHLLSLALKDIQHCKKGRPCSSEDCPKLGSLFTGGSTTAAATVVVVVTAVVSLAWRPQTPLSEGALPYAGDRATPFCMYHLLTTRIPRDWFYYFHFTDEEMKLGKPHLL